MASKENLQENIVPRTLFVGLGGTGSAVVKMLFEKCRGHETDNCSFVVLDTNVNDLAKVSRGGSKIYAIQTSNTQSVGDYLNYDEDALNKWFPKNPVLYDKTVSEGAGQVRAISRLAFNATIKTGKIQTLYKAIDDLFRKDGKELKQALRVVLVATAAGGTGSGIVLPISMLIRSYINDKYPNTAVIVRGLLMLPEIMDSVIPTEIEKDSLRRNAYATIKEINAFMMKGSGFFDIEPSLQRYKNLHIDFAMPTTNELKSLDLLPFDFCFLLDGQNAEDNTMTSKSQYMEQAAQALYEQNIGPMQEQAFSVEDNIIKEISNKGNYGRNRFGGIGAGLLRYPYDDIVDFVAYQWAIDQIGGNGESAKSASWCKYDHAFNVEFNKAKKQGIAASEMPKERDVYRDKLDNGTDNFSKDIRNMYTLEAEENIDDYISALDEKMAGCMQENTIISAARSDAQKLAHPLSYGKDDGTRGNAKQNLSKLRQFEAVTKNNIEKYARNVAESIFLNETKTINAAREGIDYYIEHLLTNPVNGVAHPNAMRYFLYSLEGRFEDKVSELSGKITKTTKSLADFSQNADREDLFDAGYTKKEKENTIDKLCEAEKDSSSLKENMDGYDKIYDKLRDLLPRYYKLIDDFGKFTAQLQAYEIGLQYVKDVNKAFERFYATFNDKVTNLTRKMDDITDAIRFKSGDSIMNVCSTRPILDELARMSTNHVSGMLLPPELNAQIYDAIKDNVRFERETEGADVVEDKRTNIFDDILIGYFKKAVDENCKETLDMNIVEAIAMEYRLKERIKTRREMEASGKKERIFEKVNPEEVELYIKYILETGKRLGAPGIQRIKNVEPREINVVAYNEILKDMRNYSMDELVPSGMNAKATNTISKYEVHFFNAIYNITPDKLQKFACPAKCETGDKTAGLYHNAYQTYTSEIGPDSTKSMTISTHIDKRWDSISFLPEIDLDFQTAEMMNIHEALVYGLVHNAIQYKSLAPAAADKMIFQYETSDERITKLVVSNGTPCDEFYEVLDSLYIDHSVVKDIMQIKESKRAKDKVKNSNYDQTAFARDLKEFCIASVHTGPTSLLEIPLAYYNSLPNSLRYADEIVSLVDAVVDVLKTEMSIWEKGDDVPYRVCRLLKEQFDLMIENYEKYPSLSCNLKASENNVVDIIYRKVKRIFEEVDWEEYVEDMKKQIRK